MINRMDDMRNVMEGRKKSHGMQKDGAQFMSATVLLLGRFSPEKL